MARRSGLLLVAAFVLTAVPAAAAGELTPRVRALDACAEQVLTSAREQSATVRDLERRLAPTDVVAYVRCFWPNRKEPDAFLSWVSTTPSLRYVLISLTRQLPPWRRIEMLGHELQHALEVADAGWVHSEGDLESLYGDIGRRTQASRACFETAAAQAVEWAVRRDLAESAPASSAALVAAAGQPAGDRPVAAKANTLPAPRIARR